MTLLSLDQARKSQAGNSRDWLMSSTGLKHPQHGLREGQEVANLRARYASRGEPESRPPLPVVWCADISPALDTSDFVEGLLCENALSVVYGDSNSGKTFLTLDLAMHVALGWPWFGREVEQGGVIYVAAEGGHGIKNRVVSFVRTKGIEDANPPLALIPASVNLRDSSADVDALVTEVNAACEKIGGAVRLIVIDTLSRALAGGDENSSESMGAFVQSVDRLRQATGAHVLIVHHSGKDTSKGARGHSLLRAAVDTEIEVSRDHEAGISTAEVRKQRDLSPDGKFSFRLAPVELGTNRRGKAVTSCVVEPVEGEVRKAPTLTPNQSRALQALRNCLADQGVILRGNRDIPAVPTVPLTSWRERLKSEGVTDRDNAETERKQLKRYKEALADKGLIRIWETHVWLTGHPGHDRDNAECLATVTGTDGTTPLRGVPIVPPKPSDDHAPGEDA